MTTICRASYHGREVFVGVDVHRKRYAYSCVSGGEILHQGSVVARPEELYRVLASRFLGAKLKVAYEAGFSGFVLQRYLSSEGIETLVVNPSSVEIAANDRVKTDKRDSLKLAVQLEAGRLRTIHIPTRKKECQRLLTRTRAQLVRERTRLKNQLRMKLHQFGYLPLECRGELTLRRLDLLLSGIEEEEIVFVLEQQRELWILLEKKIACFDLELKKQAAADTLAGIYQSAAGIGPVSARVLSNELGDMSRFKNERALFSYSGLTPQEYSSGEKRKLGSISRQGNARVRAVLIECAWNAIRADKKLQTDFLRLATRAGKKRAIVAVARKLLGRIRACLRKGERYQLGYGLAAA